MSGVSFWRIGGGTGPLPRRARSGPTAAADFALDRAISLCEKGEAGLGLLWMAQALRLAPVEAVDLRHAIRANLAAWEHQVSQPTLLLPHPDMVWAVAVQPRRAADRDRLRGP